VDVQNRPIAVCGTVLSPGLFAGALQDAACLLADPVQRVLDRGLRGAAHLQLGDYLIHLLDVLVDEATVIAADRRREGDVAKLGRHLASEPTESRVALRLGRGWRLLGGLARVRILAADHARQYARAISRREIESSARRRYLVGRLTDGPTATASRSGLLALARLSHSDGFGSAATQTPAIGVESNTSRSCGRDAQPKPECHRRRYPRHEARGRGYWF
jgi:hypothetical protein